MHQVRVAECFLRFISIRKQVDAKNLSTVVVMVSTILVCVCVEISASFYWLGNENRFQTDQDCRATCDDHKPSKE